MATKIAAKIAMPASRSINAVVVSAGLMSKTVKVRIGTRQWNAHLGKHFNRTSNILCHDPADSLRIGDIISVKPGWRVSKTVHHVVDKIIAPFGTGIEERPPVPSEVERLAERDRKRAEKEARRMLLRQSAEEEGIEEKAEATV